MNKDDKVFSSPRGQARLGGGKRKNRSERVDKRRAEAWHRADDYIRLSLEEKIAKVKAAPGNSTRQLAKLGSLVTDEGF